MIETWEDELLGPPGSLERIAAEEYAAGPRSCCGRRRDSELEQRTCAYGRCVALICPLGGRDGSGWGPVDCPCQDNPEETR